MKSKSTGCQITTVEITDDKITGRGGLLFILRYLEKVKIFNMIEKILGGVCKNKKGKPAEFILRQVMAKMIDGSDPSIKGFDRLREDEGYASEIEVGKEEMVSSHIVKRFFRKFVGLKYKLYRKVLQELFVWRLMVTQPSIIILDIDTMVLDNDDAKKREGVDVTYKKKRGYQPLQISWGNKIVDALFRRGSAHSNHGNDVQQMVARIVTIIRKRYREDVPILLTSDSGFMDEKNFEYFEKVLKIFYICYGKLYDSVKEYIQAVDRKGFKEYWNKNTKWEYYEFGSKLKSWKRFRRTIFTRLLQEKRQLLLEFARPDSVLYSNIGVDQEMTKQLLSSGNREYLGARKIIQLAHGRGASELTNRSFKEFMGREQLPFKMFGMNGAYYYVQVITHFLCECYKEDVTHDVIPVTCYPTTFRRKLIDFAAKITETGNRIILNVTRAIWESNKIEQLWRRCNNPIALSTQ
jgi:hypothetical protein